MIVEQGQSEINIESRNLFESYVLCTCYNRKKKKKKKNIANVMQIKMRERKIDLRRFRLKSELRQKIYGDRVAKHGEKF